MLKMPIAGKNDRKRPPECPADFVVDVPRVILNVRHKIQYDCVQFIGSGTYGKCFEVVKKSTAEHFACKIFSRTVLAKYRELKELVLNEIKIHRRLKHKNIVAFIESFDDSQHVYMIQSLCSENSLQTLKVNRGTVSIAECRYFMHQILQGVHYLHRMGFIHRDLKLSNILLDENIQVKICDFGLAIHIDDARSSRLICGTRDYIAPEVTNRQGFVRSSDVWACGIISFSLVFGFKPFQNDYDFENLNNFLDDDSVDNDYRNFVRAALQKSVVQRLSAGQCLTLDFFTQHKIPKTLSLEMVPIGTPSEETVIPTLSIFKVDCTESNPSVDFIVDYPEIHVVAEQTLPNFQNNVKYATVLERVVERFDDVCRRHIIGPESDFSITDYSESIDFEPKYWVAKWSFTARKVNEFTYLLSDGTFGFLLHNRHFKRTPDKVCWTLEVGYKYFRRVWSDIEERKLKKDLQNFHAVENNHKNFWHYLAETNYNSAKSPYLYTWFQTKQAMVMLLSDNTFQINFVQSHKKLLICPGQNSVTFISNSITRANFKTVSFSTLTHHAFSMEHFHLFKYVTASLKHLVLKLKSTELTF